MLKVALFGDSRATAISRSLMSNKNRLNAELIHCRAISGLTHENLYNEVVQYITAWQPVDVTDIWISAFVCDIVEKCPSLKRNIMMLKYKEEGRTVEYLCDVMKKITRYAWGTRRVRVVFIMPSIVNCLDYVRIQLEKSEVPPLELKACMEAHQSILVPENEKINSKCHQLFSMAVNTHPTLSSLHRIELISTDAFMTSDLLFWREEMKSLRGESVGSRKYLTDGLHYSELMVEQIMEQMTNKYLENASDKRYRITGPVIKPASN